MSSSPAVTPQQWEALAELRDKLAEGERIGWWIIYNGDPNRSTEDDDQYQEADDNEDEAIAEEEDGARTPTQYQPLFHTNGVLGHSLPSLLPADMKVQPGDKDDREDIGTAIPHPPPLQEKLAQGQNTSTQPKGNKSFVNPLSLRKKPSKANLHPPPTKMEEIPEPPKLKDINKKDSFRHKFFGRTDKK